MSPNTTRLQAIADSLNCLTDEDFQLLAGITAGTADAWRKRHKGPSFIRLGNAVLYPRSAVADHLETLTRTPYATAKGLL